MFLLRLDDASDYMNLSNWNRMDKLLDEYKIYPIVGIIPDNRDPDLLLYGKADDFWKLLHQWINKGWIPALHGYQHVFETKDGGINPVNKKSEFAGLSLEKQTEKIRKGYGILAEHGIYPEIFFAPAHTFDVDTLKALYKETNIRVISDTIANDIYYRKPFYFIPQQSGRVRKLPFKVTTFCYHPNIMTDGMFGELEMFLKKNSRKFMAWPIKMKNRKYNIYDKSLNAIYMARRIRSS